ncbi:hypothetical protein MKK84_11250 [Methylobacterium sp. E-065]|uniref:hypothetical protein n=1 Tax=Methylobacterium sp. E-065 TaxID=2836583 RepID=UPI001FBADDCA|nr:hypothetical protein [Methylobacterium sp. E-065]MCJ2017995.1 hypothetical protein [Methylobacterium sp. E-065]
MADTPCDAKDVALAALTNLVRLMGAELVAGRHRDDIDVFERAVRTKIITPVDGSPPDVTQSGLTLAAAHVERALAQIRAQADAARAHPVPRAASLRQAGRLVLQ